MSTTASSLGDLRGSQVVVDLMSQNDKYLRDILNNLAKAKKENNLFVSFTDVVKENSKYRLSVMCYREKDLNFVKTITMSNKLVESSVTKFKTKLSGMDNVLENFNNNLSLKEIIKLYNE